MSPNERPDLKGTPTPRLLFDPSTQERIGADNAPEQETRTASQRHAERQLREAATEDFCYRANVILHGQDRALELYRIANRD